MAKTRKLVCSVVLEAAVEVEVTEAEYRLLNSGNPAKDVVKGKVLEEIAKRPTRELAEWVSTTVGIEVNDEYYELFSIS